MHALETARETARSQLLSELNQIFRRLRHYQNEEEWIGALRDGGSKFADEFGIFIQKDGFLQLRAQQNLNAPDLLQFPATSASAFAAAIESHDTVVALRTAAEVSAALSSDSSQARARLFPISNEGRVVAILFAAGDGSIDANALELLAGMAAAVLERVSNKTLHAQIASAPAPSARELQAPVLPFWAELSETQRGLHIRARRFSRVAIAEMHLARPEACRAGREQNTLYMLLRREIDKARESYRKQFMTIPSMMDYLHLELVRAAGGDERKLGADYPGQLV